MLKLERAPNMDTKRSATPATDSLDAIEMDLISGRTAEEQGINKVGCLRIRAYNE